MKVLNRKNRAQRLVERVNGSLDVPSGIKSAASRVASGDALKAALPKGKARQAGLIAGGLAGLTAGSAGISSMRRRKEESAADS